MTALLLDAAGDTLRDRLVTWTSSDTVRVRVSSSGLATTLAHGTATITAVVEGIADSALLRVLEPVQFVTISPYAATLVPGGSLSLEATLTGVAGSRLSDRDVVWTSSGTAATVGAAGVLTALESGNAGVRATSEGITSPEMAVTVDQPSFVAFAPGYAAWHTCGVTALGQPFCWGDNLEGGLGNGTMTPNSFGTGGLPFPTGALIAEVRNVSVGAGFTCGISNPAPPAPEPVYCWGAGDHNKLGNGALTNRALPTRVSGGWVAIAIAVGAEHGCLLQGDSTAACWGTTVPEPQVVPGGRRFQTLYAGYHESCGIAVDSLAYCWSVGTAIGTPIPISSLHFLSLAMGWQHKCGVATDSVAYCWGQNSAGQLGDGTTTFRTAPVAVAAGTRLVMVAAGGEFSCGLSRMGAAFCWGDNTMGQLGTGTTGGGSPSPVAVGGPLAFMSLATGDRHTCAIATSGVAYCWGWNAYGQLGDGTRITRSAPARVLGQP